MATKMPRKTLALRWEGQEALDAATRDTGVDVTDGAARLARRVVIADELGDCTGRDVEVLRGPVQARKLFHLAPVDRGAARARLSAWLRCAPADAVLVADVNGHEVRFSRSPQGRPDDAGTPDYWHANWLTADVDPAWLLDGTNIVTLSAQGGSTWELLLETCRHPDRSAKSRDGGATWDFAHLGWNDCYDGEYLVRLELERHPARGWIAGPETDLAATAAGDALGAPTRILGAVAVAVGDVPDGTAVDLELRAGPVPAFDPARWSPWKPAEGWTARPGDRFLQWRATLRTDRPRVTPVLRAVEVRAEVEMELPRWGRLAGADNPPIVRPSHPVAFQRPYSRARMMRERWGLEAVVAGARDDLEAIERIACWTRDQWRDGWNPSWKALHACPPWDGPTILEFGRHDLGMGMCTHYATVFVHACASLGIPSRHLIHRSHCTGEAWSDRWGTWVWFDAGGDVDDATRAVYRVERDGVPLSALAAREAWFGKRLDGVRLVGRASGKFDLGTRLALLDRLCVVTRNDQMTAPHPGELEHGVVAYHYDGYLWWRDATVSPLPYLSRTSSRPGDFAWTPNRTRIHLQRTERPGMVRVSLETSMPGMDNEVTLGPGHHPGIIHVAAADAPGVDLGSLGGVGGGTAVERAHPAGYEIREGYGAWRAGEAEFDWALSPGVNRLEARSMNGFGVRGPAARVEVTFEGVRSVIGREWKSEIREFEDAKTGRKIRQLTSTGNNYHFYFSDNSFDFDGGGIVFSSDRASGRDLPPHGECRYDLFRMDLATGTITQLTDEGREGTGVGMSTKTPDSSLVVSCCGRQVKKIATRTGTSTVIYEETGAYDIGSPSISPNLRYMAFSRNEQRELPRGPNYTGFKEGWYAYKDGRITVAYLDGSGWFDAFKDTHWVGHFQFCPVDGSLGSFCHEGPWNLVTQRIWLLDFASREAFPCFRQAEEDSVGHEFWTRDGFVFLDNRGPGHDGTITSDRTQAVAREVAVNQNAMVPYVAFADARGEVVRKVDMPYYCNHYHANPDNTLLVGDDVDELVLIDISTGTARPTTLCRHGTSWHTQSSHCHPTWSWDGRHILYASDRGGRVNLYLVDA